MRTLTATFQGRFGNQMCQWLFCKAYCARHFLQLLHDPFIGEEVFQIDNVLRPDGETVERLNEKQLTDTHRAVWMAFADRDFEFRGYALTQECMIYTKRQAQEWLKIRPRLAEQMQGEGLPIVAHRRVGDFVGYRYPIVSEKSYYSACDKFGLDARRMVILSEENPTTFSVLPDHLSFLADFYRMMTAPTLLRANSTFSWLAGLLGNGIVLSPVITGLEGAIEHDVEFIPGNHARLSEHDFVSELHVAQI